MACGPFYVVYAYVCGVMGVSVRESVMDVDDEGGVGACSNNDDVVIIIIKKI